MARISINDVARALGVSGSTVSRALAGHARIGAAMRATVCAKAEAMGYRPDVLAAAAAAKRWRGRAEAGARIAYVALGGAADRRAPQFVGAREAAERLGYALEVFEVPAEKDAARVERVLRARGIRGVVLRYVGPGGRLPAWDWTCFAAASAGEPPTSEVQRVDYVCSAISESHERAFAEVTKLGWRRPGVCLVGEPWLPSERKRVGGIVAAAVAAGREAPPVFWLGEKTKPEELVAWLRAERIDGVMGQVSVVRQRLREAEAGRETGFVTLQFSPRDGRDIAGIEVDFEEIGRVTLHHVDMLLRQNRLGLPERPIATLVTARWRTGAWPVVG